MKYLLIFILFISFSVQAEVKYKEGIAVQKYSELDKMLDDLPFDVTVTETIDTINRPYCSFHDFVGMARDIRVYNLTKKQRKQVIDTAKGLGFYVIDEKDHIHVDLGGKTDRKNNCKTLTEKHHDQ